MKFYKAKQSGVIYRQDNSVVEEEYESVMQDELDKRIKDSTDVVRGEENIEFNIMDIEQTLRLISSKLSWLIFIVLIPVILFLWNLILLWLNNE
jgi:hypothetical protein